MTTLFLRRRKLGLTSVRETVNQMVTPATYVRNDRMYPEQFNGVERVVRWGCTSSLPRDTSTTVINTARAIHQVNDKEGFRRVLDDNDLCPNTYFTFAQAAQHGDYPMVVRPSKHAQGRHLYVVDNEHELADLLATNRALLNGRYMSTLIDKVAEYRVCVVSGRAVWVAKKTPGNPDDVAWNVANGGRFDNVRWGEWPLKVVRKAIEAFNLSELDFGGVDVMVDAEGEAYIIEINSAPSITSPYRQSCMAKAFDYIAENGKARIPLIDARGGWRKFVHPAISEEAQL